MPSTASSTTVAPSPRSGSALASAAATSTPVRASGTRALPSSRRLPSIAADHALAGRRIEVGDRRQLDACARARPPGSRAAIGCSLPRSRLAASRSTSASASPPAVTIAVTAGLADGQRAGLVDHQRVDLLQPLQRLGVADQDAGRGAAADADHDRHRRGEPERAGAGDDQHRHRGHQRVGEARLAAPRAPRRRSAEHRDREHQPARTSRRHASASRWIGARLRCASATILTMRASMVSAPTFSARHHEGCRCG